MESKISSIKFSGVIRDGDSKQLKKQVINNNFMPIVETDIKKYLSGGAGNTDPNASLGGVISSVEIVDNTVNNLFALAAATEAEAGSIKYRAFFIKNTHATLTYTTPKLYISSNTPSATTTVTVALADETGSPIETISDEDTAPVGPTFVTAVDYANGISLGSLAPGESKGVWVKWTIDAATVATDDVMTFTVKGETAA